MKNKLQKTTIVVLLITSAWIAGYSQSWLKYEKEMLKANQEWMNIHDTDMKRLDYEENRSINNYPIYNGPSENLS